MKRWIAFMLVVLMLIGMTGCKKGGKGADEAKIVPFTGQELVNNDVCKFNVSSVGYEQLAGFVLNIEVENLKDVGVKLALANASVNGCMCDPEWEDFMDAGEKKTGKVLFPKEKLDAYGITTVSHVEFTLVVCDDDTNEQVFLEESFTIYPLGEEAVKLQQRESQATDIVLVDNEYCTIIVTGKDSASFWGYDLYLYTVNKTDKPLLLSADKETLNGIACDAFWVDANVAPNKCGISTMYWFDDRLEAAGVTDVTTITLTLLADNEYATMGELFSQTVTLEP